MGSKIEWTGHTWNPIVGCRRVSAGCENCYAEREVHRRASIITQHAGLTERGKTGVRWNGKFNVAEKRLDEPLRRKKPTTWFVNSLSDLFFEPLPNELIAAIFGVMAQTPQHTYQVLTKRPGRALDWFAWAAELPNASGKEWRDGAPVTGYLGEFARRYTKGKANLWFERTDLPAWPLPNVHLGVSVENKATSERISRLLELPNALPWVSYEPALEAVDFSPWLPQWCCSGHECGCRGMPINPGQNAKGEWVARWIEWLVVGGESGPGARPFDLAWARTAIEQCATSRVPVFVKQLGENPRVTTMRDGQTTPTATADHLAIYANESRKRGDPSEWSEDLRVREFPRSRTL